MADMRRLILVDDDSISNFLTRFIIGKTISNSVVKIIHKPESALEYIKSEYSVPNRELNDILLLDINHAEMNAWEFLEVFSEFPEEIKKQISVNIFSSIIDQGDKERAHDFSFVSGYFEKPINKESILEIYASKESDVKKKVKIHSQNYLYK